MHKDWKQMFAAALSGELARAGTEETYRISIRRAGTMADLACAEIDRRENTVGITVGVRLSDGSIGSEVEARVEAVVRRMLEAATS